MGKGVSIAYRRMSSRVLVALLGACLSLMSLRAVKAAPTDALALLAR